MKWLDEELGSSNKGYVIYQICSACGICAGTMISKGVALNTTSRLPFPWLSDAKFLRNYTVSSRRHGVS